MGPDWFLVEFFQTYWDIVSEDFNRVVTAFYNNALDLWSIKQEYITLIPQKTNNITLSDYRPISVVSAIPKILTSRLQPFLHDLIDKNQTAFIKGRQLMQTFLSTRELLIHHAKNKMPSIFIKIDFRKAFDNKS
jgi:Reverse transcriptase (RNA-dependent DNA polymerase)